MASPAAKGKINATLCNSALTLRELANAVDRLEEQRGWVDFATYASIIRECCNLKALSEGKRVHLHMAIRKVEKHVFLSNLLITMYGKCGSLEEAWKVFQAMSEKDVVSWNGMITAYAKNERTRLARSLFWQMQKEGINPNSITFASALSACDCPQALPEGKSIHSLVVACGLLSDVNITVALLRMYCKCDKLSQAVDVFNNLPERNLHVWTAMIKAFSENGQAKRSLELFWRMQEEGVKADKVSFVSILRACASCEALQEGRRIHDCIVERGWEDDCMVGTALFQMYSKSGSLEDARRIFMGISKKDVVSWTAMITAYIHHGDEKTALKLFGEMQQEEVKPNKVTYISILNAFATPVALAQGRQIHAKIIGEGFESDVVVGTALLQMYAKCGRLEDSWKIFRELPNRNVITWNALINANVQHGHGESALGLFKQMQEQGMKPDKVTFVSILDACAVLAFLAEGKRVHTQILESGLESDVMVGTALISMYGKCGTLEEARSMFGKVSKRDAVCWTSMLAACAHHGDDEEVLQLFGQMQCEGINPDEVAFLGVLSACSHGGFVDQGWHYFHSMKEIARIMPQAEHYGCLIDLYGRAGLLDEAQDMVYELPFQANAVVWMSFLGACRAHGDVERGRVAAERLLELEPQASSPYVVLSNTYAATGRWENVEKVRKAMTDRRVKKQPGRSSIEINDKVHVFIVGDRSHPQTVEIYAQLERLNAEMKKLGYVPDMNLVLHDVEEENKAEMLSFHSEKLAISFGLLNVPRSMPIRVIKNLRICGDCHTASKFISKIVEREIVVRDSLRFHHFRDGICSCGDYW